MSKQTEASLFILNPSLIEYGGFYQQLLSGVVSYDQLGNRLITLGERAHAFRRFDKVKEVGQLLSNIPIARYQSIGYYFLAVAANHNGNGDQEKARKLFELVADRGPAEYRAKAILSLAAVSFNTGDFQSSLYYYKEVMRAGRLDIAGIGAVRGMALLKSIEGCHKHAFKDLESLLPLIKFAPPHNYFDYLNSYAVELAEMGRKEEARNVSRIVLASPFILAYPEWQQTGIDVQPPNRSFAFVNPLIGENVLRFRPSKKPSQWSRRLAKLLIFGRPFGAAMKKKKQDDKKQQIIDQYSKMTKTEKAKMIRQRVMNDDLPDDVIEGMLHILTEYELNR